MSQQQATRTPARTTARYLYAVCRGQDPARLASALTEVHGIDGQPVELVPHLDLMALVSSVPLSSYGEEGLRHNLEDLGWLELTVRSHDAVVHAAAGQATTAPMRLATICFDDDAVRARLREWYVSLTHVLDRVEGCSEWSVKVMTEPVAPAEPAADTGEPVSGAEYLRRKRADAAQRADTTDTAAAVAGEVHDRLAAFARAVRQLPPQDPRLSGHRGTMVLNAAYLVPDESTEAFAAELALLAADHVGVVVDGRGPGPPYSFAMLEQR